MKIVVCIKQVVDVSFPFSLDMGTFTPVKEDVFYKVNPSDLCALEAALNIREIHGAEINLLTFGPSRSEKVLKDCLAMGADQAIRVWQEGIDPDSQIKPWILARAAASLSPDLVLCGTRSIDEGSGETPSAIAEYLDMAQVTGVVSLECSIKEKKILIEKKLEKGRREAIACALPAVLSIEPGAFQPRYAAMPQLLVAQRAQVHLLNLDSLGIDPSTVKTFGALRSQVRRSIPRPRPKKTFSMESGLTAEQRMEMMMSGGLKKGKSDLLEGSPKDIGKQVAGILREKIFK